MGAAPASYERLWVGDWVGGWVGGWDVLVHDFGLHGEEDASDENEARGVAHAPADAGHAGFVRRSAGG